jgi:hypothetical protein
VRRLCGGREGREEWNEQLEETWHDKAKVAVERWNWMREEANARGDGCKRR